MQPADRKTLVFEGNAEPLSLFCADESDGESLRACEQTNESLYRYDGAKSVPALATECTPSADSKTWTCKLRDGVKFHNGAALDANDVVASYALQWDAKNPLHKGRASLFDYWAGLWGGYLNPHRRQRRHRQRQSRQRPRPDATLQEQRHGRGRRIRGAPD